MQCFLAFAIRVPAVARAAIVFATVVLASSSSMAAVIDLSRPLTDASGNPVQDCDHVSVRPPAAPACDKFVTLTLGRLAAGAVDQPQQNLKPADIIQRGELAIRIRRAMLNFHSTQGKLDISPSDLDLIREQIVKLHIPPSEVAQAYEMLVLPPVTPPAPVK